MNKYTDENPNKLSKTLIFLLIVCAIINVAAHLKSAHDQQIIHSLSKGSDFPMDALNQIDKTQWLHGRGFKRFASSSPRLCLEHASTASPRMPSAFRHSPLDIFEAVAETKTHIIFLIWWFAWLASTLVNQVATKQLTQTEYFTSLEEAYSMLIAIYTLSFLLNIIIFLVMIVTKVYLANNKIFQRLLPLPFHHNLHSQCP